MLLFCDMDDFVKKNEAETEYKKEEQILRLIGQGEDEAFRELYRQHSKTIYCYALSILKNHHDAEEVMQDTFIKIRNGAHLYRPMGKPVAWILMIAKNLCLMKFRKESKKITIDFLELENSGMLSYEMDADDRIMLQGALSRLNLEERKVILLHAVTGWKHKEIAQNLGKPLSTILNKYNRGLKKLRKYLEEKEGMQDERK